MTMTSRMPVNLFAFRLIEHPDQPILEPGNSPPNCRPFPRRPRGGWPRAGLGFMVAWRGVGTDSRSHGAASTRRGHGELGDDVAALRGAAGADHPHAHGRRAR